MSQKYKPGENFFRAGRCLEQAHGKCCAQERDRTLLSLGKAGTAQGSTSDRAQRVLKSLPTFTAPRYNRQGFFNAQPFPRPCQTTTRGSSGLSEAGEPPTLPCRAQ